MALSQDEKFYVQMRKQEKPDITGDILMGEIEQLRESEPAKEEAPEMGRKEKADAAASQGDRTFVAQGQQFLQKARSGFGDLGTLIGTYTSGVDLTDEQRAQIFEDVEVQNQAEKLKTSIDASKALFGTGVKERVAGAQDVARQEIDESAQLQVEESQVGKRADTVGEKAGSKIRQAGIGLASGIKGTARVFEALFDPEFDVAAQLISNQMTEDEKVSAAKFIETAEEETSNLIIKTAGVSKEEADRRVKQLKVILEAGLELAGSDVVADATKPVGKLVKKVGAAAPKVLDVGIDVAQAGAKKIDDALKSIAKTPKKLKGVGEQVARDRLAAMTGLKAKSAKAIKFVDRFKETPATAIQKRLEIGTPAKMTEDAKNNWVKMFKAKKEALAGAKKVYKDAPGAGEALELMETKLADIPLKGSDTFFSKDVKRVSELNKKYANEGLNLGEIDEVKNLFERNVKIPDSKIGTTATSGNLLKNEEIDRVLRKSVENIGEKVGIPNIKEINNEISINRELMDLLDGRGLEDPLQFTLSDRLLVGGAFFNKNLMVIEVASRASKSKVINAFIAKNLSPAATKRVTPEMISEIIDLDAINKRTQEFLAGEKAKKIFKELNDNTIKERKVREAMIAKERTVREAMIAKKANEARQLELKNIREEQVKTALIVIRLKEKGFTRGDNFIIDDKQTQIIKSISEKKGDVIKRVKKDISEFTLDPEDASALSRKFNDAGFKSLSNKLDDYTDAVKKSEEVLLRNASKKIEDELYQSAKVLSGKLSRVIGINGMDLSSAINYLKKNKKAPKLLKELKELDADFADLASHTNTNMSVDEFFSLASN